MDGNLLWPGCLTVLCVLAPTIAKVPAPTPILSASPPRTAPSASVSTDRPDASRVPALSRTSAAVADPQTILSSPVLAVSPKLTAAQTDPVTRTIAARDKVQLQARNIEPPVSTPINIDVLSKELSGHPDSHFVANLINSLRYGTPVGYIGSRQPRVSLNLQSADQQPDVGTIQSDQGDRTGSRSRLFSISPTS